MTYHVPLNTTAGVLGTCLVLASLPGLLKPGIVREFLLKLPRHFTAGVVAIVISAGWALWLLTRVLDLGEFTPQRGLMIGVVVALAVATVSFLPDYLFARAWGILLLLGTEILLSAAFTSDAAARIVVVIIAYGWATSGIIFVAAPFTFRNLLERWNSHDGMTRVSSAINTAMGTILIVLSISQF